jgi:hypothetical protein
MDLQNSDTLEVIHNISTQIKDLTGDLSGTEEIVLTFDN